MPSIAYHIWCHWVDSSVCDSCAAKCIVHIGWALCHSTHIFSIPQYIGHIMEFLHRKEIPRFEGKEIMMTVYYIYIQFESWGGVTEMYLTEIMERAEGCMSRGTHLMMVMMVRNEVAVFRVEIRRGCILSNEEPMTIALNRWRWLLLWHCGPSMVHMVRGMCNWPLLGRLLLWTLVDCNRLLLLNYFTTLMIIVRTISTTAATILLMWGLWWRHCQSYHFCGHLKLISPNPPDSTQWHTNALTRPLNISLPINFFQFLFFFLLSFLLFVTSPTAHKWTQLLKSSIKFLCFVLYFLSPLSLSYSLTLSYNFNLCKKNKAFW